MEPEQPTGPGALDAATPALAHRMFDVARDGRGEELELLQQRRPA